MADNSSAESHTVDTVDHRKSAETENQPATVHNVATHIVHQNADEKPPSLLQSTTAAIAQGVQSLKQTVMGSESSTPTAGAGAGADDQCKSMETKISPDAGKAIQSEPAPILRD
ncbi:unnamed protein product [Sphagnum jensenii]|uniref:Uncharacterized protein n=1 Tax=Sphagnum jensenii TaxID=128206 RepID=A0ABP1AJK7_9BRYO